MPVLIQLYTAHSLQPWPPVLDQIAAAGYDGVEGYFGCFDDPGAFRALLDARGLTMPQAHVPMTMLEDEPAKAVSILRTFGASRAIMPWLPPEERPTDVAGWQALGERLDRIQKVLAAEGISLAYHNHDFELLPIGDRSPMSILLDTAPGLEWEPDLGWALAAGLDPREVIAPHADRIVTVHLKDRRAPGDLAEDGWADLGHGIGDWRTIATALRVLPRLDCHVVEHDAPTDLASFLSRSKATYDAVFRASES